MYFLKAADWPAEGESLKLTVTIYQEISGLPENKTSELRNVRFFSVEIRSFDSLSGPAASRHPIRLRPNAFRLNLLY
jgi:hypothetical protein